MRVRRWSAAGDRTGGSPRPHHAQIAAQLYISIRTINSHLDRIRDKTGCRYRADLIRLVLATDLV
jgi:DNA-binding NarL/FixJ family response regulator